MRHRFAISAMAGALLGFAAMGQGAQAQETVVEVRHHEQHGRHLADGQGRALYIFGADVRGDGEQAPVSTCQGNCTVSWPPLINAGQVDAGDGVEAGLIATIPRPDGEEQVTYHGWPLYYFTRDEAAGEPAGHGVEGFGGTWSMISPKGERIGE